MSSQHERPDVFQYLDYRTFVRDYIEYLRAKNEYSTRKFAQKLGLKGNSFVSLLSQSKRHASAPLLSKMAKAFGLREEETRFFKTLSEFAQAADYEGKEAAYRKILFSKRYQNVRKTARAEYEYFSKWYVIAILEALGTSWAKKSKTEMSQSLGISVSEVSEALRTLENLGYIENRGGVYMRVSGTIHTPDELQSLVVGIFHRQMIQKASESIQQTPSEFRSISSLTVPLSEKKFLELKKRIMEFHKEVSLGGVGEGEADKIYQMNIQLFPLVKL